MVNNLPGPDKGLLDILFGGGQKANATQAVVPGEASAADFTQMLAQAQDQKAMPAANETTAQAALKGEFSQSAMGSQTVAVGSQGGAEKQKTASALGQSGSEARFATEKKKKTESDQTSANEAMGVAAMAAGTQKNGSAMISKAEQAAQPKTPTLQNDQRKLQHQLKPTAGVQKEGGAPQVGLAQGKFLVAPEQFSGGKVNATKSGQESWLPQGMSSDLVQGLTALPNQGASQQQAMQAVLAEGSQAPQATVLQPIIVQTPMAFPVTLESRGTDPVVGSGAGAAEWEIDRSDSRLMRQGDRQVVENSNLLSSQDFIDKRANILGVGRADPRLQGRAPSLKSADLFERPALRSLEEKADQRDVSLVVPQLMMGREPAQGLNEVHELQTAPMAGRASVDVSNPMVLASQIERLANQGGGVVRVRVMPENLGELVISVKNRGSRLDVQFEASSSEARQALLESAADLKSVLQAARHDVGNIEVAARSGHVFAAEPSVAAGSSWNAQNYNQDRSQDGGQSGRLWDQYLNQRDGDHHTGGGRQHEGHKRYREYELGA
ncbi:MAG: flagellar hook-length control protein FliK [Bdellovibrionota bacterium]